MHNLYSYSSYYYYLSTIFLFFVTFLLLKHLRHTKKNLPPSPLSLPIIGHLYLIKSSLHQTLASLSTTYGPVFHLRFGCRNLVVVSSPSAVEECFTKNDVVFANRPRTMLGDRFSYNYTSLFWAPYGQLWRVQRRVMAAELFSSISLQKSSLIQNEEVEILIRSLFKASEDSTRGVTRVSLNYWAFTFMFNVMMRIGTGKSCVSEEDIGTSRGKKIIEEMKGIFFVSRLFLNVCDFLPVLKWIRYKGIGEKIDLENMRRDEYLSRLLDEFRHKKSISTDGRTKGKKTTMIEILLSLRESEPELYTNDIIKGVLVAVFVAGTETTSMTIQWALRLLLAHPEAFHKLRAEIDSNVGNERLLNESDFTNLPYLNCVINETLRLYPPVPLLLPHYSLQDCTIGGYHVPKHTILMVNAWAIHRDPELWDEPEKFKPERFEGMEGDKLEVFNYKFVPFGMGRRACSGANMGMRTISLVLGSLVQWFDWKNVEEENYSTDVCYSSKVTTSEDKPWEAICIPRQNCIQFLSQL